MMSRICWQQTIVSRSAETLNLSPFLCQLLLPTRETCKGRSSFMGTTGMIVQPKDQRHGEVHQMCPWMQLKSPRTWLSVCSAWCEGLYHQSSICVDLEQGGFGIDRGLESSFAFILDCLFHLPFSANFRLYAPDILPKRRALQGFIRDVLSNKLRLAAAITMTCFASYVVVRFQPY